MSKCTHCFDEHLGYNTGEVGQRGYLDCGWCGAAVERVALNQAMADAGPMIEQDAFWHAYQLGRSAALES